MTINAQPVTPTAPVLTLTQPTCSAPTGTITVTVQNPGETYSFDNGASFQSGNSRSGLAPGTYNVVIQSQGGCNSTANQADISTAPGSPASPTQSSDCSLGSGNARVTVMGPTGSGLEYSLDGNTYQASATFTGVANGSHTITVRNASGCTTTGDPFTISCGCTNAPALNLSSTSGSTCGTSPVTINGNTFSNATTVTITSNGAGSVSPSTTTSSPFAFTYTPSAADEGNNVTITVTTDNPSGAPCIPATLTYTLTVNDMPAAPAVGTITQPTCTTTTGSVILNNLPSGNWTINPGSLTGIGSSTTISSLNPGTYNYTVTNSAGCVSPASSNIVIDAVPGAPAGPSQTTDCSLGSGNATVTVTSPTGTGLEYSLDGVTYQAGTTFNGIANGNHTITVRNASGCTTSGTSFSVSCGCANAPALTLSSISGSTCRTNSVTITGNTFSNANNVTITSSGAGSVTPASATSSPFSFTYTPAAGDAGHNVTITLATDNPLGAPCSASTASYTLMVNSTPSAPVPGTITQPTCTTVTGGVVLNGLPSTGIWTINPGSIANTGTSTTISSLILVIITLQSPILTVVSHLHHPGLSLMQLQALLLHQQLEQ